MMYLSVDSHKKEVVTTTQGKASAASAQYPSWEGIPTSQKPAEPPVQHPLLQFSCVVCTDGTDVVEL